MKIHFIPVVICAAFLSACSEDSGFGDAARQAVQSPSVLPAPAPDNSFCKAVALQDSEAAPFDPDTKRRTYADSLRQCVDIYVANDAGPRVANTGSGATVH